MNGEAPLLKRTKLAHIVGLVVLVSLLATGTILAQGALPHFAPLKVETLKVDQSALGPKPALPRWTELADLEKLAGFPLLQPTYLPQNCNLRERFYEFAGSEARLNYSCVLISERKGDLIEHPRVGPGSVHEIMISGSPALYIEGMWIRQPNGKDVVWMPDVGRLLVLERNGLILRLMAAMPNVTENELIRIAESMK